MKALTVLAAAAECPTATTWPDVALFAVFILGPVLVVWAVVWAVTR